MDDLRPERCMCTALRQAARHVSQHYDCALAATGISTNQYAILRRVAQFGPLTVQALAARLVMDRSTLGRLLGPLAARDLLQVGTAAADRRRKDIVLTPEGAELLRRAQPLWEAAQARLEAAFGPEAAADLRLTLRRVADLPLTSPPPE